MAWVTPHDFTYQESITSTIMDGVKDNLLHLGELRPHGRATDASFSHNSSGNWLTPSWDSIATNVGTGFATSTGHFSQPEAGFYLLGADATFAANATGARGIMLSSGTAGTGTIYAQNFSPSQSIAVSTAVSTGVQLSAGASVYVSLLQGSGGTLTCTAIHMWAIWMTA